MRTTIRIFFRLMLLASLACTLLLLLCSSQLHSHAPTLTYQENESLLRSPLKSYEKLNLTLNLGLNPQDCKPRTKVALAKTHKTASSAVMNILLRYALEEELNVVLPNVRSTHAFYMQDERFSSSKDYFYPEWHWDLVRNSEYDMFVEHTRFNIEEIRKILGPDTTFITILRDPVDVFESIYTYYSLPKYWGNFTEFLSRLQRSHTWRSRSKEGYGLNQQSFDLAADVKVHAMDPQVAANLTIGMLERDFSLVMLSERMEESLVLLAQQLCLPLHRVAVFKKNARTEGRKRELTAQQRKLLTRAQKLDVMVYNHFQRAFQKAVEDFGEQRMEKSVDELRRIKKQILQIEAGCGVEEVSGPKKLKKLKLRSWGANIVAQKIDRKDIDECVWMTTSSVRLVELVSERQMMRFAPEGEEARPLPSLKELKQLQWQEREQNASRDVKTSLNSSLLPE